MSIQRKLQIILICCLGAHCVKTVDIPQDMACHYEKVWGDTFCFEKKALLYQEQQIFMLHCDDLSGTILESGVCPAGEVGSCVSQSLRGLPDITLKGYNITLSKWNTYYENQDCLIY